MGKPTKIDEQSQAIMQGILNEANYQGRHYINKQNNEKNRTALQYQLAQMLHKIQQDGSVKPIATDDEGTVYDFEGLNVVENKDDLTVIDIEAVWKPRATEPPKE